MCPGSLSVSITVECDLMSMRVKGAPACTGAEDA